MADHTDFNDNVGIIGRADVNGIVRTGVARHVRSGHDVRFVLGAVPVVPLRSTAFSRLVANLLDNAIAYGAPPVEVSTRAADRRIVLEIADRGAGIASDQVERLKQPFTRASRACTAGRSTCFRAKAEERSPES